MKVTITSTTKIVQLNLGGVDVPARLWEGVTETGVPVHCFVTRVAVPEGRPAEDYAAFERDLLQTEKPSPAAEVWPLRMFID